MPLVVGRRLAGQRPRHRGVQAFLAVVEDGGRLFGHPNVILSLLRRAPAGGHAAGGQVQQR